MYMLKKWRVTSTALNNPIRPLRDYQKDAIEKLENKRRKIHNTQKVAVLYLDSDGGTGKDDMMYYFGHYTALPGKIMLLAPEIAMCEKVVDKWPLVFQKAFKKSRGFHTTTIQGLWNMFKNLSMGKTLNQNQKTLLTNLKECGTLFFNEVHRLSSGKDLEYIPTIREGLEKLDQYFTIVNVSANVQNVNEKAWGVPLDQFLVQTQGTDIWLNTTQLHTVLCGCKVTYKDAASASGIEIKEGPQEERLKEIFIGSNPCEITYDDVDAMKKDVKDKYEANKKLKEQYPDIDPSLFDQKSKHLVNIATIEDMVDRFVKDWGLNEQCLVFTPPNVEIDGEPFSYSDYAVDYINKKAKKNIAHAYNSEIDRTQLKELRVNFEKGNNKSYKFLVCKCMLIEDFDKINLRFLINCVVHNNPKTPTRKQRYMRVRRTVLENPLDHTTNIKLASHIYQATNIRQVQQQSEKFDKTVLEGVDLKKIFPENTSSEVEQLFKKILAEVIKSKIAVTNRTGSDFEESDVMINPLDEILNGENLEGYIDKIKQGTYLPPKMTVDLNKVSNVESGHCIVIKDKSWADVYGDDRFTTKQYEDFMKNKLSKL